MGIINEHFYDRNALRNYPLDDTATCINVAGVRLPSNIIVDLNLRYPDSLGAYPFLAALTVNVNLVCFTIQGAATLTDGSSMQPIAVCSVPQPVMPGFHYPLEGQYPGVGGWVVFGEGAQADAKPFSGLFASPVTAYITPRAARSYKPTPVTSIGQQYAAVGLTGIVGIQAQSPVNIAHQLLPFNDQLLPAIVFSLTQTSGQTDVISTQANATTSILAEFVGPCGGRPESRTCGDPQPIEFINSVSPACDGNINIHLSGCAIVSEIVADDAFITGIVIDCGTGLTSACTPPLIPDNSGKLPNQYDDQCNPISESIVSNSSESIVSNSSESVISPGHPISFFSSYATSDTYIGELPYLETFDDGTAVNWLVMRGGFSIIGNDIDKYQPSFSSISSETSLSSFEASDYTTEFNTATFNVAVWNGFDQSTLDRRYTTDVVLLPGPANSQHNAGLVLNLRPWLVTVGESFGIDGDSFIFFIVGIDYDIKQFSISRYNGTSTVVSVAVSILTLQLNHRYRLIAETSPGAGSAVNITATLAEPDGEVLAVIGPLSTTSYLPDNGRSGVTANRSAARFAFFQAEEI